MTLSTAEFLQLPLLHERECVLAAGPAAGTWGYGLALGPGHWQECRLHVASRTQTQLDEGSQGRWAPKGSRSPRPYWDCRQDKLLTSLKGFRKWNKINNKNHPDTQAGKGSNCHSEIIRHVHVNSPSEDTCLLAGVEGLEVLHSWVPVAQEESLKGYTDYQLKRKTSV